MLAMYITDLRDEDIELSVKVVIVGNGAVGKSSMIQVSETRLLNI